METIAQDGNLDKAIIELETEDMSVAPEGVHPKIWEMYTKPDPLKPNRFLEEVKRGMTGQNIGLENGLTTINRYTYGTHQARYYLLGADSSVGKTTIADFMFVLKAWESAKKLGRPLKIFYCSFEVGRVDKIARWVSYYIFAKFGIRLPSDYIIGRITGKLVTGEHLKLILQAYEDITEIMKDIVFVDHVIHPTMIFEDLITEHFEPNGVVTRAPLSEEDQAKGRKKGYVIGYKPNDPNMMTILVIDHLALTGSEQKLDTKGVMDRMSKYCIVLRNMFHCTLCMIQQFSTDLMSFYRSQKTSPQAIAPQRVDFGDSKATFRDADVVFGLINPISYDFKEFMDYPLIDTEGTGEVLGHCFRAMYLMKNRYGPSGRAVPLFLDGVTGTIYDLPLTPKNDIVMQPWYQRANQIEAICQEFFPQLL